MARERERTYKLEGEEEEGVHVCVNGLLLKAMHELNIVTIKKISNN